MRRRCGVGATRCLLALSLFSRPAREVRERERERRRRPSHCSNFPKTFEIGGRISRARCSHTCAICSRPRCHRSLSQTSRAYVCSLVNSSEHDDYKSMKSRRVIRKSARDYVLLCRSARVPYATAITRRHASPRMHDRAAPHRAATETRVYLHTEAHAHAPTSDNCVSLLSFLLHSASLSLLFHFFPSPPSPFDLPSPSPFSRSLFYHFR